MDKVKEKENISCNFCGSSSSKIFDSVDGWDIVICNNCKFHYTNPRPILKELYKYYDESYFTDIRHSKKFYNEDGSVKESIENYDNRILNIENYVNSKGRLLEIGAARGGFLKVMHDRGWEVKGVEISEDAVKLAKEVNGIDLFCGSFEDYSSENKFDVICMYQTLEHVANPKEIIKKSYELLNKAGVLIIEVPNINGYDIKKDKIRRNMVYDLPRHLNHFSPSFLSKQIKNFGFQILEIDKYYPQFILDWMASKNQTYELKSVSKAPHNKIKQEVELKKYNKSWKVKLLDSFSNLYPGWRFTVIAKKLV